MSNGIFNELEFELQPVQSDDEAFGARLIAGHVIGDFPLLHAYFGNERTYGRLVGLVQAHMRVAGGRVPRDFALSRQPAALLGFEFRGESHLRLKALRRRLRIVPCLERRKLEVSCKPFAPREVLAFPAGATHVSFVWVFGQLPDFTWSPKKRGYRPVNRDHARERFLPMPPQPADTLFNPEGVLRLDLPTELPNPPRTSLLVGLGVVFFRQADTQLVAIHAYNNCVVVKVVV